MAWNELDPSGNYFICFRLGKKKFKRSLKTTSKKTADSRVARLEENLRDIERGRLAVPENADLVTFLLSDGRVPEPMAVSPQVTLKGLFDAYFKAIPSGSLEDSTISGMETHQKHLQKILKASFPINKLSLEHLQDYVTKRSKAKGRKGSLSPATCKKEVVTLRTVWNWGLRMKLVEHPFPSRGLKYPKGSEKPPFMSFAEVVDRTRGMKAAEAALLWESVYLPVDEIEPLLQHVASNCTPFVHPMFCFGFHTGARRSEMLRAKVSDVDLKNGWVTIHERKKAHDKKTTRRVPISATLHAVLKDWLANHPGGTALFCHGPVVARSKKRSLTTGHTGKGRGSILAQRQKSVRVRSTLPIGPVTGDEAHDYFKSALAGTKWGKLKGWHVMRHSFISALACKGVDQRIIDDFTGHQTEEQRRRYRHLLPATTKQAIAAVFG